MNVCVVFVYGERCAIVVVRGLVSMSVSDVEGARQVAARSCSRAIASIVEIISATAAMITSAVPSIAKRS